MHLLFELCVKKKIGLKVNKLAVIHDCVHNSILTNTKALRRIGPLGPHILYKIRQNHASAHVKEPSIFIRLSKTAIEGAEKKGLGREKIRYCKIFLFSWIGP